MRARPVFRALFGLIVFAGLISILVISVNRSFPKQKQQFLQDTISILEKGIEVVDDFRQNENGQSYLKKAQDKTRAEEGTAGARGMVIAHGREGVPSARNKEVVIRTRAEAAVVSANGKLGMVDTRGKESAVDSLAEERTTKTHAKEGVVDARGKEGAVDSLAEERTTKTHAKEGVVKTRTKEGVTDARGGVNLTNTHSQGSSLDSKENAKHSKPERLSLIMIGHDRSGTTFINRMFNEDPNVFNVYEPLWVTKGIGSPENHENVIMNVLNGILSCNFSATTNGIKFLAGISEWIAVRLNCKAMMSPPFCKIKNGERVCEEMPPGQTDEVCANRYKYSVVKLAVTRIPNENISCILERLLDENPQARVLYMVRDPRGTINSRINAGWTKDYPDPSLKNTVNSVCHTTTYNLRYIQLLMKKSEYKDRSMIVRYRDICAYPLAVAKKIYNFAGFQIERRLTDWVMNHTRPSKKKLEIESRNRYSVVRNATGNADKWRKESPVERVRIINEVCAPLLRLLGVSD